MYLCFIASIPYVFRVVLFQVPSQVPLRVDTGAEFNVLLQNSYCQAAKVHDEEYAALQTQMH